MSYFRVLYHPGRILTHPPFFSRGSLPARHLPPDRSFVSRLLATSPVIHDLLILYSFWRVDLTNGSKPLKKHSKTDQNL